MDPQRRYWFPIVGYNYRLTNIQCAIGLAQLERLDQFLDYRRELVKQYQKQLRGIPRISFQKEQSDGRSSNWIFNVHFDDRARTARLTEALEKSGVETRPVFPPLHKLPPYQNHPANCPMAEIIAERSLSLPTGNHVGKPELQRICEIVCDAV